ncbi:uncharacterized protein [Paramisgurnus dabryanus]|uniref:uncharacterized protein n=1 Tax=Paramisgurnus dabryanus TaxID=90735 RepID=UPI0031F379EC
MMSDGGKRRTKLKDNSWIRRDAEEDDPVDYDPNFGKSVLGRLKSGDDVDSPPVNSGTSVSSVIKRFGNGQEVSNKSSITTTYTKTSVTTPTSPTKPPVPVKNSAFKTSPNTSSFTARVFSGANTNNNTVSPVKRSFGEKIPEVTVSQTISRTEKTSSVEPPPAPPLPAPVPPSPLSSVTSNSSSTSVKSSSVIPSPVKSSSRNETVSFSYESPNSSITSSTKSFTSSNSSSLILEETRTTKPTEKISEKLSDVSYSSTTPSSDTLNTRYYTSERSSASLDGLAENLIPSRTGSVYSQSSQYNYSSTTPSSETLNTRYYTSERSSASLDDNLTPSRSGSVYSYSSTTPSSDTLNTRYYTSERSSASLDDNLTPSRSGSVYQSQMTSYDQPYSTSSQTLYSPTKTTYSEFTSTRNSVSSRNVCSVCGKPIDGSARMILEDLKISSHTSCFKCSVCNRDLGNLEAGKSLWVHRDRVNCSNCYSKVKGQWYL